MRQLQLEALASFTFVFDFGCLLLKSVLQELLVAEQSLDLQLQLLFLDLDAFDLGLQLLVLLVNPLFSLITVLLQRLRLRNLRLQILQLRCQLFAMLAGFKLVLLCRLVAALEHLNLLVGMIDLRLPHVDSLHRVLVRLGEGDQPLASLLQEAVRFSKLFVEVVVRVRTACRGDILGRNGTFKLDAVCQLELFGDRVDKLLDFADVPANLVDHLALLVDLLLHGLKDAHILLAHLLGRILLMTRFLQLHRQPFVFELQVLNLALLLLRIALFSLSHGLQLPHFMVQVLYASQQSRLRSVCILDLVELQPELPFHFLVDGVFLDDSGLRIVQVPRQVIDRGFPLLRLRLYLGLISVSQLDKLALEAQIARFELLERVHVGLGLHRH